MVHDTEERKDIVMRDLHETRKAFVIELTIRQAYELWPALKYQRTQWKHLPEVLRANAQRMREGRKFGSRDFSLKGQPPSRHMLRIINWRH